MTCWGSSPLARGLPPEISRRHDRGGIIPARAGFTRPRGCSRSPSWDHPRSRGVYKGTEKLLTARQGIIPARAGFTASVSSVAETSRDHPRSRGVYGHDRGRMLGEGGSSPLARGLPRPVLSRISGRRLIPARAGFTRPPLRLGLEKRGSSPLARGLRIYWRSLIFDHRIIPARAGFTCACRSRRQFLRDHPRSRGVYLGNSQCAAYGFGSSPLARGLRARPDPRNSRLGIIPARAGFTPAAPGSAQR